MKHLSRFDIEAIADKYVQAYMALPDVRNTQIYRIDPELLLEKVLGLNVEYQHLSYDGSILGMTSFTEMGVQVFEDDDIRQRNQQKDIQLPPVGVFLFECFQRALQHLQPPIFNSIGDWAAARAVAPRV